MSNSPNLSKILYRDSYLYSERLTYSETELEYWVYSRPVLSSKYDINSGTRGTTRGLARRAWNMAETRNNVRRLVNANVGRYGYEAVFLTFTYAENMCNIDQAWSDWKEFMRKMRRRFGEQHALSVMEFQKRGAIHFHCIFFNLSPEVEERENCGVSPCYAFRDGYCAHNPFSRVIASLWGHGFVDIERIRSAKNVGAYVCKYLNKSADDERLRGKKFYSTTMNLFRPVELRNDLAKEKFMRMIEEGREMELLSETTYDFGGSPVLYRNYKLT